MAEHDDVFPTFADDEMQAWLNDGNRLKSHAMWPFVKGQSSFIYL